MSGQLLELIFFAGLAIFIISKLISLLGSTNEDDPAKEYFKNSYFGEPNSEHKTVKNVASTATTPSELLNRFKNKPELEELVTKDNFTEINKGLQMLQARMPNFSLRKFISSAKAVLPMLITAAHKNQEALEELVDKRYIEYFKEMAASYGYLNPEGYELSAEVSELYMFGNSAFIKVLFTGNNVTAKINNLQEEWTFSRNINSDNPTWFLTNIDRPQ